MSDYNEYNIYTIYKEYTIYTEYTSYTQLLGAKIMAVVCRRRCYAAGVDVQICSYANAMR